MGNPSVPITGSTGITIDQATTEAKATENQAVDTVVKDLTEFAQRHAPSIKAAINLMTDKVSADLKAALSHLEALAAKHGFTIFTGGN